MTTSSDPKRSVLVTGAGGFVGGHVARHLARSGYRVRALSRKEPFRAADDPPIDWLIGDLNHSADVAKAVEGMRDVVHAAGWVSLGGDPFGQSRKVNVDGTRDLLDRAEEAGVERFVYTSTLWTTAAGTAERPARESSEWNLDTIRSPYSESKREAERIVLARNGPTLQTVVICPGMVVGAGDRRPSSTRLLLTMARLGVVVLPGGGIPLVDARVLAEAHRQALETGEPGTRYVVAGPYLSYHEIARIVHEIVGRPRWILKVPDLCETPFRVVSGVFGRLLGDRAEDVSPAATAGGFLRLHVSGERADAEFGLEHPPPARSIFDALDDHFRSGRAPWLSPPSPPRDDDAALAQ